MNCEYVILIFIFIVIFMFIFSILIRNNQDKDNEHNRALTTCRKDGKIGTCVNTKTFSCDGKLYSGLCAGSASVKCCIPNTLKDGDKCNDYGGTCENSNIYSCGAITDDAGCIPPLKCCNPLNLGCLEKPGGERIQDNSELLNINSVSVQAPDVSLSPVILHKKAASSYINMISQARKDGIKAPLLGIISGYRSDALQKRLWNGQIEKLKEKHPTWSKSQIENEASKWVARPGYSNHRSGRTVDLVILNDGNDVSSAYISKMKATKAWKWLNSNASKFGFYPYTVEPWHWEYNPKCI